MLKNFFEFKEENEIDEASGNVPAVTAKTKPIVPSVANNQPVKNKPWKAKKPEISAFWAGLKPDLPLKLEPIPYDHKGSSILQDGIRITGSK